MSDSKSRTQIQIKGASEHNLQNVSLNIPRNALVVFSGVSGSGKSSLAFDVLYKEGQRRFLESLSPYARQFLGQMEKPQVEHISGLSPTIAIDQKTVNRNPRSTVGTITELYDHYRLLMARLGTPHCPNCNSAVGASTADEVTAQVLSRYGESEANDTNLPTCLILAPMVRERKGEYRKELALWQRQGYARIRINGQIQPLDASITLARYEKHTLELVLDRLSLIAKHRSRLTDGIEQAFRLSKGLVRLVVGEDEPLYSNSLSCPNCQIALPEMEPRLFSFNDPLGACPTCKGLGKVLHFTEDKLVDEARALSEGALRCLNDKQQILFTNIDLSLLKSIAHALNSPFDLPWQQLPSAVRKRWLWGDAAAPAMSVRIVFRNPHLLVGLAEKNQWPGICGILTFIQRFAGMMIERFQSSDACKDCHGLRLNPIALAVRFREQSIASLTQLTIEQSQAFFSTLKLSSIETTIGKDLLKEITYRLHFLSDVGVGYLNTNRAANTLSGGEAQRIRLASQLGSGLQGVLYILDEPSIGLHPSDNLRLIHTLQRLRDVGNTVCVVEHDQETMQVADHLIDMGPGAGREGGTILVEGSLSKALRSKHSISGQYLSGKRKIAIPTQRRQFNTKHDAAIEIKHATLHNLKNLKVRIPLKRLVVISGVSGSGKSTLVHHILTPAVLATLQARPMSARRLGKPVLDASPQTTDASCHLEIPSAKGVQLTGLDDVQQLIEVNQAPIGRTPRSNPATYTKVFDHIRQIFAALPLSKQRGYAVGRFSFNVKGGRCETCQGAGICTVPMQFLNDVEVVCDECEGNRFNPQTLEVTYKGKTIAEVLNMSVVEAREWFSAIPSIEKTLSTLEMVGLGYISLGQPSTTLSGGEAQRIKLAAQLRKKYDVHTLYILDEPTTGLHFSDIDALLTNLNALVDRGNSVIVIEHNTDVIKCADYLIDLGPGGGEHGGQIVATGSPEQVANIPQSLTGQALQVALNPVPFQSISSSRQQRTNQSTDIMVRGASQHNLKGVSVRIPRNSLTVISGVSGSGKTSLAFDTLFAEGQARYVESLSTYARRFLGRMDKARVDKIEGLSPAIAINQKHASRNPRSTVATTTEIYDYLRLLYARIGSPHCPRCKQPVEAKSPAQLARQLSQMKSGNLLLLAPLYWPQAAFKGMLTASTKLVAELVEKCAQLQQLGINRIAIGAAGVMPQIYAVDAITGNEPFNANIDHIDAVIDRVEVSKVHRLADDIERAYQLSNGVVRWVLMEPHKQQVTAPQEDGSAPSSGAAWGSEGAYCPIDDWECDPLTPRMFSFNAHMGACTACDGLGIATQIDPNVIIANPKATLWKGALASGRVRLFLCNSRGHARKQIVRAARKKGVDLSRPLSRWSEAEQQWLLFGDGTTTKSTFGGLNQLVMARYHSDSRDQWRDEISALLIPSLCTTCKGERLKPISRAVSIAGKNISQFCHQTVKSALAEVTQWDLNEKAAQIAEQALKEVQNRLQFLRDVGLGYLTLDRTAATLSGGEAQRIRLASQLGSHLVGVLYVLDEPTIGLHARDTARLLSTLFQLRDLGNTVVLVEHDLTTIRQADWLIDMGPAAGQYGGNIVAANTPAKVANHPTSLTGAYLAARRKIASPERLKVAVAAPAICIKGAVANNLQGVDVTIPLERFVAVSGVSGSGKSTLITGVLQPLVAKHLSLGNAAAKIAINHNVPYQIETVTGLEHLNKLIVVDQNPIGRTPKSSPATYTKALDKIRNLFAQLPAAKQRGYAVGRFSFNVPNNGRCEACEGYGFLHVEMHFLPDVWTACQLCKGKRYNHETLQITFREKNIADVLDMEIADAAELFANQPSILTPLQALCDVGLGYVKLGQSAHTLSGGEAQRVKLATELGRKTQGGVLYILDEPTTGLHLEDIAKLLVILRRLVAKGNTVVVIEHNLDVLWHADYLIDLGPEGGSGGGKVVASGPPQQLLTHPHSHTGQALQEEMAQRPAIADIASEEHSL